MGSSFLIGVLTFGGIFIFALLLMRPVFAQYVDSYAVRVRPKKVSQETSAEKPHDSMLLNLMRSIGELVLTVMPALADKRTVQYLTEANYRTPSHLAIFIGIKSTFVIGLLLLAFLSAGMTPMVLLMGIPAVGCTWYLPNFMLAGRAGKRKDLIIKELPNVIDLLLVASQAGLGLLMACDKVAKETKESCPIMSSEMEQMINDIKIFAKSVPLAMREMGERCGVDELINMATSLIAAEAKGADISYPLKQQSEALTEKLKRKKEEEAAKVPVKMIPVIMIFIMPLLMCPMLGPAVITVINSLMPMFSGVH